MTVRLHGTYKLFGATGKYAGISGHGIVHLSILGIAALLAAVVRSRRAQLDALRDRATALERERVSAAAQAAAEERLRIARDVHDLVGHGLSGIAVQSSTARLALEAGRIELARAALSAVESSSRAALGEMRQLLGVLRAGDTGGFGRAPGLGDLPDLVGRVHGQGVMVTLRADEFSEVPGAVSLAAYRVVQEALTNVVKHSGGGRAIVEVSASGGAVLVMVEDYADPAAATAGPPASASTTGSPLPSSSRPPRVTRTTSRSSPRSCSARRRTRAPARPRSA